MNAAIRMLILLEHNIDLEDDNWHIVLSNDYGSIWSRKPSYGDQPTEIATVIYDIETNSIYALEGFYFYFDIYYGGGCWNTSTSVVSLKSRNLNLGYKFYRSILEIYPNFILS